MKKILVLSAVAFILIGCGSDTTTYEASGQSIPEIPQDTGTALIVTASEGSSVGISYTEVSEGSILVDCGAGGCGDILVGSEMTNDTDDNSQCAGGNCSHPEHQ